MQDLTPRRTWTARSARHLCQILLRCPQRSVQFHLGLAWDHHAACMHHFRCVNASVAHNVLVGVPTRLHTHTHTVHTPQPRRMAGRVMQTVQLIWLACSAITCHRHNCKHSVHAKLWLFTVPGTPYTMLLSLRKMASGTRASALVPCAMERPPSSATRWVMVGTV